MSTIKWLVEHDYTVALYLSGTDKCIDVVNLTRAHTFFDRTWSGVEQQLEAWFENEFTLKTLKA